MNVDHIFRIGSSHDTCEDYSYSGLFKDEDKEGAYALISDGCSSSKDTDVGARMVLHEMRTYIKMGMFDKLTLNFLLRKVWENSARNLSIYNFEKTNPLDATLCGAVIQNDKLHIFLAGDGGYFIKYKSGDFRLFKTEYSQNCPFYGSYLISNERKQRYLDLGQNLNFHVFSGDENYINIFHNGIDKNFMYEYVIFPLKDIDYVAVFSDGINSFQNETATFGFEEIYEELFGYKNFNGEFVKRRIKSYLRKCQKEGINHFDDISFAAIKL